MSTKPRVSKPYKPENHPEPKQTHKLPPLVHAALVQLSEAQQQLQSAKANIYTKVAQDEWKYPAGVILDFNPNLATGDVVVIMRGEAKSNPEEAIINATKQEP